MDLRDASASKNLSRYIFPELYFCKVYASSKISKFIFHLFLSLQCIFGTNPGKNPSQGQEIHKNLSVSPPPIPTLIGGCMYLKMNTVRLQGIKMIQSGESNTFINILPSKTNLPFHAFAFAVCFLVWFFKPRGCLQV